jgi:hypothetical protein
VPDGYTVLPIVASDKVARHHSRPFLTWDFHDDCPDYERTLTDWGWIEKPAPITMENLNQILKATWVPEKMQTLYAESPLLNMLDTRAITETRLVPWWKRLWRRVSFRHGKGRTTP